MTLPPWLTGTHPDGRAYRPRGAWGLYASHILGESGLAHPELAYMRRWILSTPWGTVRLHRILRADRGRSLHDHPWDFTSWILRGGYTESQPDRALLHHRAGSMIRHRAEDLHRIASVLPHTLTLVFTGPMMRRRWGFATAEGWVDHRDYRGEA